MSVLGNLTVAAGFLADAYDLFVINIVVLLLRACYGESHAGEAAVATAALAGAVIGQLVFGALADRIGRRTGFIVTLSLVAVGGVLSGLVWAPAPSQNNADSDEDSGPTSSSGSSGFWALLATTRFILGMGVGGEYPLSATISVEQSAAAQRGKRTAAVFAMQGVGMIAAPVLALVILAVMPSSTAGMEWTWRLLLLAGALPALAMLPARCRMPETQRFASASGQHSWTSTMQTVRTHWRAVLVASVSWFLFDIAFYANGLFSATVLESTIPSDDAAGTDAAAGIARIQSIVALDIGLVAMGLPGYVAAVALVDRIGRKVLQGAGFVAMTAVYVLVGMLAHSATLPNGVFIVLYGLSFMVAQAPNTTTFIVPGELVPTSVRATVHGLAAATGKLGAVVGGAALKPVLAWGGIPAVMFVCAAVCALGAVLTWRYLPDMTARSLDEVEGTQAMHGMAALQAQPQTGQVGLAAGAGATAGMPHGLELGPVTDAHQEVHHETAKLISAAPALHPEAAHEQIVVQQLEQTSIAARTASQ